MRLWSLNYLPPGTEDRVYFQDEDIETDDGKTAIHAHLDDALAAGATQIGMLLNLMS